MFIPSNRYELAFRYDRPSILAFKNIYVETKLKYVAKQHRAPRVITVRQIIDAEDQSIDLFANDNSNFDFMAAPNGYGLLNLAVGASLKRDRVQYDFRIAAENALNQSYREYTNRFRYYADDVGRNFIFSLKCIF